MADVDYLIRPLRQNADDLQSLARLERDCAQGTIIKLCFGSDPPRHLKFTEWIVLVCEEKTTGRVVGGLSANVRSVLFYPETNRFEKVSWVFNLRVEAKHRRYGLASALRNAMYKILLAKGVTFAYFGTAFDNIPSQRFMMEKFGCKPMWSSYAVGINLGHVIRILPNNIPKLVISAQKLDVGQSETYLRAKFARTFLIPTGNFPIGCNVYSVKIGDEDEVSVAVTLQPDVWTLVDVPLWLHVVNAFYTLFSYFLPRYFERPLPLGKPWRLRFVCPFYVNLRERTFFKPLLSALFSFMIRDLHETTDAMMIHTARAISNLDEDLIEVLKGHKYISPTLFKGGGLMVLAKSMKSDLAEAEEMENYAKKQPFWFIDGKEL